ncbi:MAG: choice-of-anchor R domain-containing protein [Isosphaeraceae bacterium]
MRFSIHFKGFAVAAALLLTSGAAGAQTVIVGNIALAPEGNVSLPYVGQKFTTDGNAYTLSSVRAILGDNTPISVNMRIYSDNAGTPGSSLFDLGGQSATLSAATTWTAPGAFTLSANTTYWAVAFNASNTWRITSSTTNTGTGTFGDVAFGNDGTTWLNFANSRTLVEINGVAVAAVPEPGPAALAGLAGSLALITRVRLRRGRTGR